MFKTEHQQKQIFILPALRRAAHTSADPLTFSSSYTPPGRGDRQVTEPGVGAGAGTGRQDAGGGAGRTCHQHGGAAQRQKRHQRPQSGRGDGGGAGGRSGPLRVPQAPEQQQPQQQQRRRPGAAPLTSLLRVAQAVFQPAGGGDPRAPPPGVGAPGHHRGVGHAPHPLPGRPDHHAAEGAPRGRRLQRRAPAPAPRLQRPPGQAADGLHPGGPQGHARPRPLLRIARGRRWRGRGAGGAQPPPQQTAHVAHPAPQTAGQGEVRAHIVIPATAISAGDGFRSERRMVRSGGRMLAAMGVAGG